MLIDGGVCHTGSYNPWDHLKRPEIRKAYDEAIASGGFAFRTGEVHVSPGGVSIDAAGFIRVGEPSFLYKGDGLMIVRIQEEDKTV